MEQNLKQSLFILPLILLISVCQSCVVWVLLCDIEHVCSGNREGKVRGRLELLHKSSPFVS